MVRYEIVNMFAARAFGGSALAVVPEADGLATSDMQAIARELNLPETAFVLSPSTPAATYRVRIFTPAQESPFGGHASIGIAATLAGLGKIRAGTVVQECGPRLLSLRVAGDEVTATATDPLGSRVVDPALLLAACCLGRDEVSATPGAAGFGPLYHYLPMRRDAVARARLNADQMRTAALADVFVFSWSAQDRTAHARLFAPGYGIPEDPACSSAALGLGLWLVGAGWLPERDGTHAYQIRQGVELNRPAILRCSVTLHAGRVTAGSVTGRVVSVAHGHISVRQGLEGNDHHAVPA
jgi:trans-2,3-dihydro-3-hydroxyanthranilate isomerase